MKVYDAQTGLRGFSISMLQWLSNYLPIIKFSMVSIISALLDLILYLIY